MARAKRKRKAGLYPSSWIRPEKRYAIYCRDGWACVWCDAQPVTLTLDHLFPRGHRARDNDHRRVVTSCVHCNTSWKDLRLSGRLRAMKERGGLERVMARLRTARHAKLDRAAAREAMRPLRLPSATEGGESLLW